MATLDGQVVLMRTAGELIDCARFGHISRIADSFLAQERNAYRYLAASESEETPEEALCAMMGMTPEVERRIEQLFEVLYSGN